MKKSMLVLTAALMFGGMVSAQTAATASAPQVPALTDVPAGHWAKDAIDRLVSRGIILGYPDGTYRGTQNLTRYEAAVIIARLLDQMATGTGPVIGGEDLVALQNAVQELAADLAALGVRVSDLEENAVSKDDFSRLEARVEQLAAGSGDPEAVAALQAQIDDLTARADEYDTLRADVDDNASSIAALNDLTVLLNQDILDLQDRVSAVEAAQADFVTRADFDNLSGKVTAIDTRVGVLEKLPRFSVSGSIDAAYGRLAIVRNTNGGTGKWDITRLTTGTFAAGVFDVDDSAAVDDNAEMGNVYTGTGVRFGVKATQLTTTNGAIVVNNAAINFRTANPWTATGKVSADKSITVAEPYVFVNDANADGTINGQKFTVKYHRTAADFKFTDYLFNNMDGDNRRGIVATVEATTLPGDPKLTMVAGSTNDPGMVGAVSPANYWGVNAAWTVGDGGKFGVSYAQVDSNRTAVGVNGDLKFGVVSVKGEAILSVPVDDGTFVANTGRFENLRNNADGLAYIEGRADLGGVKIGANYRTINPVFGDFDKYPGTDQGATSQGGMSTTWEGPYDPNQTGFGVALGTNLGPVALGAYADRYTRWNDNRAYLGFGVKAGAQIGALEAVAFYNNLTFNGNAIDNNKTGDNGWTGSDVNKGKAGMGIANVPFSMTSTFGGQVKHDGAATNALVKNLNFTLGDAYFTVSKTNSFYVYGDYTASLGGFTLKPLFRYRNVNGEGTANDYNAYKFGVKASMNPMTNIPLEPSLFGNFVMRSSTVTGVKSAEMLGQVGIGLNRLLIDGVSANVGYSYYQGANINPIDKADDNYAFNAADDRIYSNSAANGQGVTTTGIYAQLGWSGLTANYGVFKNNVYTYGANGNVVAGSNKESIAHGFKVSYNFKF